MKELSIEEKAKAYDEAIEALRSLFAEQAIKHCDRVYIKDITNLFPEFKGDEDERMRKGIIRIIKGNMPDNNFRKRYIAWLEKQGEQKPWSEEDEDMCYKATAVINRLCAEGKDYVWSVKTLKKLFYWLKDLKDRVQPKQEWSEEDERNLNDAILFIETGTYSLDKDNLINWLKSLRRQTTWKPSDEQMEALKSSTYCQNKQMSKVLFELYQDLLKLKE